MKEEKDRLRDYMQGAFQDYEVAPDPQDWSRIEKTLSKGKARRIIPWIIWSSAACLLLLLALYTGGILNHSENTTVLTAAKENKTDKTPSLLNVKSTAKEAVQAVSDDKSLSKTLDKLNHSKANGTTIVLENKVVDKAKSIQTVATTKTKQHIKPVEGLIQIPKTGEPKNTFLAANQSKQIPLPDSKDKTVSTDQTLLGSSGNLMVHAISLRNTGLILNQKINHLDLKEQYGGVLTGRYSGGIQNTGSDIRFTGLALSNSSGMIMQSSGKEMMSYSGAFASQLTTSMYNNSVKVFNNSFLVSSNIGNLFQNNSRNYFPPVTFGLNVNLSLQKNLSFETGIQYTRLQSSGSISITSSNAIQFTTSFGYHVDENLYYLGVPLILNYNFAQSHKTAYYFSGGLSIEKGLIAKYKATPIDNYPGMEPIYSHNTIRGLQYSMFTGIGISYKFINHFELFGQPSLTWYLNSAGNNNTFYSLHPLIFNLRTGIRYTIR